MATNSGKGSRVGAVSKRSQFYNPATGNFIKRDTETGQIIDVKTDGKPFKGVRREKTTIKSNPNIDKATAQKAENAVRLLMEKGVLVKARPASSPKKKSISRLTTTAKAKRKA